jgi:hypothetical protein
VAQRPSLLSCSLWRGGIRPWLASAQTKPARHAGTLNSHSGYCDVIFITNVARAVVKIRLPGTDVLSRPAGGLDGSPHPQSPVEHQCELELVGLSRFPPVATAALK